MTVCGEKMSGVCVMGKCPYVKQCNTAVWDKTPQEHITNEVYIRTCSVEELAGMIYEWHTKGYTKGKNGLKLNSVKEIAEWLKQPHKRE